VIPLRADAAKRSASQTIGTNFGLKFNVSGEKLERLLASFADQFFPRLRDGRPGLRSAIKTAEFLAGCFQGFSRHDAAAGQIAVGRLGGLLRWAFEEVKLVNPPVFVAALFRRLPLCAKRPIIRF